MTVRLTDNATLKALAEQCVREAEGDLARAYRLAGQYIEGGTNQRLLRNEIHDKFIAAAMVRIGDAHPFKGKSKFFSYVRGQDEGFIKVGIYSDGQLWNPTNYPEDKVRAALRYAAARRAVRRKEGAIRAVETRARRHSKLIHEIGAGILAGRKYGPRPFCCLCKKNLSDPVSIERGIGPECWDYILVLIEHAKDREAANAPESVQAAE
jgi:hypothetical protein